MHGTVTISVIKGISYNVIFKWESLPASYSGITGFKTQPTGRFSGLGSLTVFLGPFKEVP
jgi:hypothetical protein